MKNYLLFIDTEASGLPKNWRLPYDHPGNWPNCVQISWVIYTHDGILVKEENHYIKNIDFHIAASSTKIHGITQEFLQVNGECRREILQLLQKDVRHYDPLVVGHFMQFDINLLNADYFREDIENPISKTATFCTMLGSVHLINNPSVKFLRLEQLYHTLFNEKLENPHNAIVDARATAKCFFEMLNRNEINGDIIERQQAVDTNKQRLPAKQGCILPLLAFFSLLILILYYL